MSIYLIMTTDGAGLIPSGRSLLSSVIPPYGGTIGTGTAVAVAAGSLTTSGSGTGVALSIQGAGGSLITVSTTASATGDVGGTAATATQNRLADVLNLNLQSESYINSNSL